MYVYGACLFNVCCTDWVGVCGNVCCVAVLECWSMVYVMDVVFYVCIVTRGALGARAWEVWVFRHAYVVCLCLVCILWQFQCWIIHAGRICKMRPYGRGILQSRSHDCLIGSHECLLLVTPIMIMLPWVMLSFVVACVPVLICCKCVCCMFWA